MSLYESVVKVGWGGNCSAGLQTCEDSNKVENPKSLCAGQRESVKYE